MRGRPGTRGFFGTYALGAANNFWGITEDWQKIRSRVYGKGGANKAQEPAQTVKDGYKTPTATTPWWSGGCRS